LGLWENIAELPEDCFKQYVEYLLLCLPAYSGPLSCRTCYPGVCCVIRVETKLVFCMQWLHGALPKLFATVSTLCRSLAMSHMLYNGLGKAALSILCDNFWPGCATASQ